MNNSHLGQQVMKAVLLVEDNNELKVFSPSGSKVLKQNVQSGTTPLMLMVAGEDGQMRTAKHSDLGGGQPLVEPVNTIVIDGDSITALNNVATHYSDRGYFTWLNAFLGQSFTLIKNVGGSGQRSDQILARLNDTIALSPDYIFVMFGVNDFSQNKTASFVLNNMKEYIKRAQSAGIRVIASTATPTSKWTTQEQKTEYYRYNRALKEYARTQPGLILVDMGSAYLTQDATAAALNHTVDETHPSALGAVKMAKIAAAEIKKHITLVPSTLSRSKDDPDNLLVNGVMYGTGGSTAQGTGATVSGAVPDGWVLGGYVSGTTVTATKKANVDYPGDHLYVSLVGGTNLGNALLYREVSPSTQPLSVWAVGDSVYGQIELEITVGSDITNIEFGVDCRTNSPSATVAQYYGLFHESAAPNLSYSPSGRLTLRTPTFKVPAAVDRLRLLLRVTGTKVDYDVYLADLRKA